MRHLRIIIPVLSAMLSLPMMAQPHMDFLGIDFGTEYKSAVKAMKQSGFSLMAEENEQIGFLYGHTLLSYFKGEYKGIPAYACLKWSLETKSLYQVEFDLGFVMDEVDGQDVLEEIIASDLGKYPVFERGKPLKSNVPSLAKISRNKKEINNLMGYDVLGAVFYFFGDDLLKDKGENFGTGQYFLMKDLTGPEYMIRIMYTDMSVADKAKAESGNNLP